MDDKVDVLPLVVVMRPVRHEAVLRLSVKSLLFTITNKAKILHVNICLALIVSQLSEGIDDNTEDNIQKNCDDQEEEGQIIDRAKVEALAILWYGRLGRQEITNTATTSKTIIQLRQEAVHHGHADGVTFGVQQASVDVVIVERVVEEDEANSRVDVYED